MSRIVYVGGFGGGKGSAEKIGKALEGHFEEVDTFTLSDYVNAPTRVMRAARGVSLMTHSAGALSLPAAESQDAYLLNPPLPRRIGGLVARSLIKSGRLYASCLGPHSQYDIGSVNALSADVRSEIFKHPIANLAQLPNISRYNAVDSAGAAIARGVPTSIVWTHQDLYFQPSESDLARASQNGVQVTLLEGQHDEVILQPETFLDQVLNS